MRVLAWLAIAVLAVACGASSTAGSPSPSASSSPTAAVSPSTAPTPSPVASQTPTPSPVQSPVQSPTPVCFPIQGGTASRAIITDVRVGMHPTYDRLVIEFTGGLPAYKMVAQDPSTFVGPFSGLPVKVAGHAGIHLYIYNMDIPPTFQHGNILTAYPELRQVVVMAVFEGQADIAIGLDHAACPSVSTLGNPSRLVIDFPTP